MTRPTFGSFSILALSWAATSSVAEAACPAAYSGYACGGGTLQEQCCDTNSAAWTCHLTVNGDLVGGTITVVSGLDSGKYSAWGTDSAGNNFCCTQPTSNNYSMVAVDGSSFDDTISFTYTAGSKTYDLANKGSASRLVGFASGGPGDDTITGSNNAGAYLDALHGDDDDDTIYGNTGADQITGDAGNDLLYGGASADTIDGGDGDDTIYGEAGADTITGGNGNDYLDGGGDGDYLNGGIGDDILAGQGGDDSLYGDSGFDTLCAGAGADHLCGGADDDQLWGDAGVDSAMGMAGTDACSAEAVQTCESTLTTKPALCP